MPVTYYNDYYSRIPNNRDVIVALDQECKNNASERHLSTITSRKPVRITTYAMTQWYSKGCDKTTKFVNKYTVQLGYITKADLGSCSADVDYIKMLKLTDVPPLSSIVNATAEPLRVNGYIIDIAPIEGEEEPFDRFDRFDSRK